VQPDRIGKYAIAGELGKGSMGIVYAARPDDGGPEVAVKVFYPDTKLGQDETRTLLDRFVREGQTLQQIHHRNIVHVIDVGATDQYEFIVMEKLAGFNLKELLELGTRFTLAETLDIMLQLLAGLAACHRAGIVHRDIKPANVVRASDGTVKLTDFGIARVVTDQTLSRQGTVVGTPNYMSPEQIRGEPLDPRSDIFSAGVLMYELLTCRKPFEGPDVTAIMYNVANIHPPSPRFYNGALPEELDATVYLAIAKNAAERFASADDFAAALRGFEQDLHYRDGTEAILNALPSAPDADALLQGPAHAGQGGQTGMASQHGGSLASAAGIGQTPIGGGLPGFGAGSIIPGSIYCLDCGMQNKADSDFCVRCMRPLVSRDMLNDAPSRQHSRAYRIGRGDYIFLSCLSIVMVAVVLLILYLFFKGTT
jgi:serine/threonine-protein kinase